MPPTGVMMQPAEKVTEKFPQMHRLTVSPELTLSRRVIQIAKSLSADRPELILYKNKICGAVECTHICRPVHALKKKRN